jgi:hypothetical protein
VATLAMAAPAALAMVLSIVLARRSESWVSASSSESG